MGDLILGVNTLYRLFCFFKLFPMVGKGLNSQVPAEVLETGIALAGVLVVSAHLPSLAPPQVGLVLQ